MKKLFLVMAFAVTATATFAQTARESPAADFEYDLTRDGEGVKILKYKGRGGAVVVPAKIEGIPVIVLGEEPGENWDGSKVQYSGCSVFANTKVTSVVLPDSIRIYDNDGLSGSMFGGSALQSITFPKETTVIPAEWFRNCKSLKSVTIPGTVERIGGYAFAMSGLESVVIPEGVAEIGHSAFSNCTSLTSVTLPQSIQTIKGGAFQYCRNLVTVNLPPHKIGYGEPIDQSEGFPTTSFEGCSKLSLAVRKAINDSGYKGNFN